MDRTDSPAPPAAPWGPALALVFNAAVWGLSWWPFRQLEALGLQEHLGKQMFMLSTGSRRKVALTGLLASGATITCLDQPYASLDMASIAVLREFLGDMGEHPTRAWLVADYEADPALPWRSILTLSECHKH